MQLAWFPFILYNTDWMGREIYHGSPSGTKEEIGAYTRGVQQGAFGLLLNSVTEDTVFYHLSSLSTLKLIILSI